LSENVILVDKDDVEVGVLEKIIAHKTAARHRAVLVIILDDKKNILMQRRSRLKAIALGGLSSINVPDVVHSEHFRVGTPCTHP
jgi:hypothetical protein